MVDWQNIRWVGAAQQQQTLWWVGWAVDLRPHTDPVAQQQQYTPLGWLLGGVFWRRSSR